MIALLLSAAAVADPVTHFRCDLMYYPILEGATLVRSEIVIEGGGNDMHISIQTPNLPGLSAARQDLPLRVDEDGLNHVWPASLRSENDQTIHVALRYSASTHETSDVAAIEIRHGGDYAIGPIVENDEEFLAVGICSAAEAATQ